MDKRQRIANGRLAAAAEEEENEAAEEEEFRKVKHRKRGGVVE